AAGREYQRGPEPGSNGLDRDLRPQAMTGRTDHSLHAFVRGRVQGVGFRAFVIYNAQALGLTGFARNLGDELTVEVVAEGPRDSLEALLTALHAGPRASKVERVDVNWGTAAGTYDAFAVR